MPLDSWVSYLFPLLVLQILLIPRSISKHLEGDFVLPRVGQSKPPIVEIVTYKDGLCNARRISLKIISVACVIRSVPHTNRDLVSEKCPGSRLC